MHKKKLFDTKKFLPKQLIIATQFFSPDFAATGQLLNDLTDRLSEKGIFVKILTGIPSYSNEFVKTKKIEKTKNKIIYRSITSRIFPKKFAGKILNGLIFSFNISLKIIFSNYKTNLYLFTTEPAYLPIIASIISIIFKKKYILLIYDLYPEILFQYGILKKNNVIIKFWQLFNKLVFNFSEEIIVLSDPMKLMILNYGNNLKNKISVFPSWSDPEIIHPISKEKNIFIKKNNLRNKFVVLYSGNQGRCHDMKTIIEAAKLLKSNKKIVFVFIGNGFHNNELREIAKINQLNNCKFMPYQNYSSLSYSLSAADVSIVSVKKGMESLVAPSKLYGHLAVGSPIIGVSQKESFLEKLIKKEKFGLFVENGDVKTLTNSILKLLEDSSKKVNLGKRGLAYFQRNATPEIVSDKYFNLLNKYFKI